MPTTIFALKNDAVNDLQERLQTEDYTDIADLIHEIADWRVPLYNKQLLSVAISDLYLAICEPEVWPAFDGRPTAINLIAANIYECLVEELRQRFEENK